MLLDVPSARGAENLSCRPGAVDFGAVDVGAVDVGVQIRELPFVLSVLAQGVAAIANKLSQSGCMPIRALRSKINRSGGGCNHHVIDKPASAKFASLV